MGIIGYVLIRFAQPNVNCFLFILTLLNSYKDNAEFDGLVAQAIKHLALLTKSHSIDIYWERLQVTRAMLLRYQP